MNEAPKQGADEGELHDKLRRYLGKDMLGLVKPQAEAADVAARESRAAQYLRMSTDHQKYSIENQTTFIAEYARQHGWDVVRTYTDEGKSGVSLDGRPGLQSLLSDVLSGSSPFSKILVLDVSRWGRFQDADEAAHYEFLCREAGISVVYCAELFSDDAFGSVFKQLKRVMAGEYSRELSVKVRAGRQAKSLRGRALGGRPIYGVQRQVVNPDGSSGELLADGFRKQKPEQEVTYTWGPPDQIAVVRQIFELYVREAGTQIGIARYLNHQGVPWRDGTPWNNDRVRNILRSELVVGFKGYGKSRVDLGERSYDIDRSNWRYVRVMEPIVDLHTFISAQERMATLKGKRCRTDVEMMHDLRKLLSKGKLSGKVIDEQDGIESSGTYRLRFGSLRAAYRQLGYHYSGYRRGLNGNGTPMDRDQTVNALRDLYSRHGWINLRLIKSDRSLPGDDHIRRLFGSIPNAYRAAGLTWGRRKTGTAKL